MRIATTYNEINIKAISTEGQLIRVSQDDDHVIELASSIAAHGLLEPIVVIDKGAGEYQLLAGAHRLAACKRIGWAKIPAMVRPLTGDEPIKGIALIENVVRKNLTLEEEMNAVQYLTEVDKLSMSQLCQLLGKGRRWVETRLQALNYPIDLRTDLIAGNLSLTIAEILAAIKDEGLRKMIANAAQTGRWTAKQTESMRDTYLATENFTEAVEAGMETARQNTLSEPAARACELCGQKRTYVNLRPLWVCADPVGCAERCDERDKAENAKAEL